MSIVISCIALAGVTYGLILQALQLRANQLQISRVTQLETVKMVLDDPRLLSSSNHLADPGFVVKAGAFLNYRLKQLELSYSLKAISLESVRLQAELIFAEGYPIEWWGHARNVYAAEASTKRERQFFAIVDKQYMQAKDEIEGRLTQKPQREGA